MSSTQFQGFPTPQTPLVDRQGILAFIWYQWFASIWRRTGAGGAGDAVFGGALLNPATESGFLYIPGGDGPPTGVPMTYPGQTALYADRTNSRVYAYFGGWVALN